ncbi:MULTISPECIES: hypothetical protein [unclassified Microbacterium]|uniref:hypothetical protein n=1 Tax=unclassified Microbacterium TaxID=2609290 RepID=UPI0016055A01|nr:MULTISPECIES: hypothetical protein [unclassified Microbacterium]QNA92627.1 hypothetical protein G4G29_09990 [Microbacterium sp. Se63.02b]QYM65928.1 hypothetical protein K1X59_10025 [Microbacterium sp. Se5.02b]
MTDGSSSITLCCLLWARPGHATDLTAYEDSVLALLADHGATVLHRVVTIQDPSAADDRPDEVQTYSFPNQAALDAYLSDPRRRDRSGERDRVIARTVLFPVDLHGD